MKKVSIIGSGFSSLAASSYLAKAGYDVTVFEKNEQIGGRARLLEIEGFKFDMGPSWYWMPDVFDRFFKDFGYKTSDFYTLEKLSPAYSVFFEQGKKIQIPSSFEDILDLFEKEESGSGDKLRRFIKVAQDNYEIAIKKLVYKPGLSPFELVTTETIGRLNQFFTNIRFEVRRRFKNPYLIKILEFPVLFLGAKPQNTPAFYNFMNYADFVLGTWFPKGGFHSVIKGMEELARQLGVKFHTNANVDNIITEGGEVSGILVNKEFVDSDIVLSGADYQHTESLLDISSRSYKDTYWDKRILAPSALLFYVGFNKKIQKLTHHNLFFDKSFDEHAKEIYDTPAWPKDPLFYANFPSMTDSDLAPKGKEAGFFLIPLAPDLEDTEKNRNIYFEKIINRLEELVDEPIREHILFSKSYCVKDFKKDYNSLKGNAYGMSNTLRQTAFLRPRIKSKKVKNLYFTGQLTVPGPGVPPSLISGKIVSDQIIKENQNVESYDVNV